MIGQPCKRDPEGRQPWPCCRDCTRVCSACGDRATRISRRGKVVGGFCGPCYRELAEGAIPGMRPSMPRRPRGPRLRDLQAGARASQYAQLVREGQVTTTGVTW